MYRRLVSLDYVLERPDLPWLPTEAEKLACFDALEVPRTDLPYRIYHGVGGKAKRYFADKHLIAVDTAAKTAVFVYVDSEEQTRKGLRSWRQEHGALWRRLFDKASQVPVVAGYYSFACMKFPHPREIDPEARAREHLRSVIRERMADNRADEVLEELHYSAGRVKWSKAEALEVAALFSIESRIIQSNSKQREDCFQ